MPRRVLSGVVKAVNGSTLSVFVSERFVHERYGKVINRVKKYLVDGVGSVGDFVEIEESRPISKRKSWVVKVK